MNDIEPSLNSLLCDFVTNYSRISSELEDCQNRLPVLELRKKKCQKAALYLREMIFKQFGRVDNFDDDNWHKCIKDAESK